MADQEMIQEKIGEALGLEKAAQKAVEDLDSRGLLKPEHMKKLAKMREEASDQEEEMQKLVQELADSDGFDPSTIEALEFLCLAEGGEVTHYEVLVSVAKDVKNKKFGTKVRAILKEEKRHLDLCTKLAKSNAASE